MTKTTPKRQQVNLSGTARVPAPNPVEVTPEQGNFIRSTMKRMEGRRVTRYDLYLCRQLDEAMAQNRFGEAYGIARKLAARVEKLLPA